jgi:hypothetical protein
VAPGKPHALQLKAMDAGLEIDRIILSIAPELSDSVQ